MNIDDTSAAERLSRLAEAYRGDADFRADADSDPRAALADYGIEFPPGPDVRFRENTAETFHFVFPDDPNGVLNEEDLGSAVGGSSASTAGSAGSVSTLSSILSCAGSASSAGSVGSAGTASP